MIQKDIVYTIDATQCTEVGSDKRKSTVDSIFASADASMAKQWASYKRPKQRKKRRPSIFLTVVIPSIIIFFSIIAFIIYGSIISLQESLPAAKTSIIEGVLQARQNLLEIDDELLTVDEYYQKRMLLLLSEDELIYLIENVVSMESIEYIAQNGTINTDLIPENKVDEFKALLKEYEEAKKAESENEFNSVTDGVEHQTEIP